MALNDSVHWHDSRIRKESAKQRGHDNNRRNPMSHSAFRFTALFERGYNEYDIP